MVQTRVSMQNSHTHNVKILNLSMVASTSNLSTMEAEAGGFQLGGDQPDLLRELQASQAKGRLSQILPNNK